MGEATGRYWPNAIAARKLYIMSVTAPVEEMVQASILEIDLHGRLNGDDYGKLVPPIAKLIHQEGEIRVLVRMHDFDAWDAGALWEDIQWEAKHFNDIERLAIVGERNWHKWMAGFCRPFTTAEIRYFTVEQIEGARAWLQAS